MKTKPWVGRALGAALLAGSLSACDYINLPSENPNAISTVAVDQLFTGIQANTFFYSENMAARLAAIWTQQLAGTDRQFSAYDVYQQITSTLADDVWAGAYAGGGLVDLRKAIALAEEAGRRPYAGILKVHVAYLMGMTASFWGDVPFAQAGNFLQFPEPEVQTQAQVYAGVQQLLDEAIADLAASGAGPGRTDLNFQGNPARWTAVANTLKARFYLHWVEAQRAGGAAGTAAQTACSGNCIDKALAAAQSGITAPAGNWNAVHSAAATEANAWFQFQSDRSGYISAGFFLLNLLQQRNDPRLRFYYQAGGEGLVGSRPGANTAGAASLNTQPGAVAGPSAPQPIVSCAENQFIIAETQYYKGNLPAARSAVTAGVACSAARPGFSGTIPVPDLGPLTGRALLEEIITQKYIALFLNAEVYNDFKRTCLPNLVVTPAANPFVGMPRRFPYPQDERETNSNIRAVADVSFNTNDPLTCAQTRAQP